MKTESKPNLQPREVIVMAFECEHCGFRNNELQSAGVIAEKGHTVTCKIENKEVCIF
jgi:zinc finger protein